MHLSEIGSYIGHAYLSRVGEVGTQCRVRGKNPTAGTQSPHPNPLPRERERKPISPYFACETRKEPRYPCTKFSA